MRTIILIALISLILIVTVFLSVTNRKPQETGVPQITVIPTPTIPGINQPVSSEVKQAIQRSINTTPPSDRTRVLEFAKKLPYQSAGFELAYDTELGVILVSISNTQAYAPLRQYLSVNNVLDVYLRGSSMFVVSNKSLAEMRSELRDENNYEFEETEDENAWIRKLPIRSETFLVDYDPNTSTIVVNLTVAPENEASVKAEINTRLRSLGVPLELYTISYTVTNP